MSEFNIEDLDALIARSREGSLAQLLALQLKRQIRKSDQMAADNEKAMDSLRQADAAVKLAHEKYSAIAAENVTLDKMRAEHRADGVDMLYSSKAGQWPSEYLAEIDEFSSLLREGAE